MRIPKKKKRTVSNNLQNDNGRDRGRGRARGQKRKVSEASRKSLTRVTCLQLTLDILQVFHNDRDRQRSYFEGPYVIEADGQVVGKVNCFVMTSATSQMNYSDNLIFIVMPTCPTNMI